VLRHDKSLHAAKVQPHMKNVPDYLVPPALRHLHGIRRERKGRPGGDNKSKRWTGQSKGQLRHQKRKADPLKSFELSKPSKRARAKN